jgi:hypothetical protein
LTLLVARDYAGRKERAIDEGRQKGALYALLPIGKERGFRYPKWQFDADGAHLKAVLEPFVSANANSWSVHSFMRTKREELGGRSPADVILDSNASVARVVDLAAEEVAGPAWLSHRSHPCSKNNLQVTPLLCIHWRHRDPVYYNRRSSSSTVFRFDAPNDEYSVLYAASFFEACMAKL